jgi:hypothetical protein
MHKLYESPRPDLQKLSKTVYEVEAFYAPVCEIIGYDALAMALRDYTMRIRVLQSEPVEITAANGTKALLTGAERINKAEKAIETLGTHEDIQNTITDVIQSIYGESINVASIENSTGHNIQYGVGTFDVENDGVTKNFKFRWRVKSIGSLATKYEKYSSPLDLIGITIIPGEEPLEGQLLEDKQQEAEADVAVLFDTLITRTTELEAFVPTATPDRENPFFAEGSQNYIDIMDAAAGEHEIQPQMRTNGFQVAKGTMLYHDRRDVYVPMEIQVQTLLDRRVARIGRASHPVYKVVGREVDVPEDLLDDLLHLAQRKHSVNEGPTLQSAQRAHGILREIDTSPPPPHIGNRAVVAAGIYRPKT